MHNVDEILAMNKKLACKKEIKFTVKMTGYSFMDGLSFFCINLLINSDMLFLK